MEQVVTKAAKSAAPSPVVKGKQIRYGSPVYNDIVHFLIEEAYLLDNGMFKEWLEYLADDVNVSMPVRQTFSRKRGDGRGGLYWVLDDKAAITFKALRFLGDSAWADDPPSRVRRMITNVRVHETPVAGEYAVDSNLLLQRNTGNQHDFTPFSALRNDILRKDGESWKLANREVLVDQVVIGQPNLGFML